MSRKPQSSLDKSLAAVPYLWLGVAITAFCVCAWSTAAWEVRPERLETPLLQLYAAPSAETEQDPQPAAGGERDRPYQRIVKQNGTINAEYAYLNFNSDRLRTRFSIDSRELAAYLQNYGYQQADLDALRDWQARARTQAFQQAREQGLDQERLNRLAAEIHAEYLAKYRELLVSRGFKLLSDNRFAPDIPGVVGRNVDQLHDVALSLNRTAEELNYDAGEIVGAALALVQTALHYENIPAQIDGRITAGIYPPLQAMALGKGDCDTKTALLASILLNWDQIRLVGVGVPNHYLMGILQNPAKGDLFVEYQGLPYVLVEPAGPAWLPPGSIADYTQQLLDAGEGVTIDPLVAQNTNLN